MAKQLFSFQAKPYECIRLARLLRQATKDKLGDAGNRMNAYFGTLCKRYGYADPESCQITIVAGWVFVHDYPSFEEIVTCHV
jgi:hypothetical protein